MKPYDPFTQGQRQANLIKMSSNKLLIKLRGGCVQWRRAFMVREYNPLQLMMKQTLVRTTLEEYPLAEYSLKRVSPLTKFKPNYSTAHPLQNLLTSHTPSHTFHVPPPQFRSEIRVQELFSNLVTARHGEDDEKERNKSCWHGPIESAYSTVCFWHTAFESSARLSHKVLWAGQVPPQFNTHTHSLMEDTQAA